ncbi:MAG: crossover junction endodeoxyribonuclease RuvC, partial [Holosporales bacterium]
MPPRSTPLRKAPNVRLIGLDPGLNHTGWGVLETSGNRLIGIAAGIVSPPKDDNLAV